MEGGRGGPDYVGIGRTVGGPAARVRTAYQGPEEDVVRTFGG